MSNSVAPKIAKWPFLLGDVLLVGWAVLMVWRSSGSDPMGPWEWTLAFLAVAAGAWLGVIPFLREYQAALKLGEAEVLATSVSQIEDLEEIKAHISNATAQWQSVQNQSTQTVTAAREITERIQAQLAEVCAFLQKAHDAEKNHLRLEVEKLRRGEREWLQLTVHILDHVFALHQAGTRSGQPAVVAQLNQFQLACRDAVRRVGLVAFAPAVKDPFDPQAHQLEGGDGSPEAGGEIGEILAVGYTFQGELVRRALVRVQAADSSGSAAVAAELSGGVPVSE